MSNSTLDHCVDMKAGYSTPVHHAAVIHDSIAIEHLDIFSLTETWLSPMYQTVPSKEWHLKASLFCTMFTNSLFMAVLTWMMVINL